MKIKWRMGRNARDPEKAVLPALIYCNGSNEFARVYVIALGWWDWSIKVSITVRHRFRHKCASLGDMNRCEECGKYVKVCTCMLDIDGAASDSHL